MSLVFATTFFFFFFFFFFWGGGGGGGVLRHSAVQTDFEFEIPGSLILTYLGSGFGAPRYRSPPRASTPLSYIVHIRSTHIYAKAFVGSRGGNNTL